jgi:hypothetical protein
LLFDLEVAFFQIIGHEISFLEIEVGEFEFDRRAASQKCEKYDEFHAEIIFEDSNLFWLFFITISRFLISHFLNKRRLKSTLRSVWYLMNDAFSVTNWVVSPDLFLRSIL